MIGIDDIAGRPRLAADRVGDGPLVLFMHGIGGNRTNWDDQLLAAGAKFCAVAWDARGYGLSHAYDGPLDFADFSADVQRVLDHYNAESAHLVGLSLGGRIAQDFYERSPERVASLVLVDTFPGYSETFRKDNRQEFIRLRIQPLIEGKEPRDVAPDVVRTLVGPNASEEVFQRLVDSMAALQKESYIKTVEATTTYERVADLERFDVPTLLIFGGEDKQTPPEVGQRMHMRIKDSKFIVIEGAGHLSNIEEPDKFNEIMMPFLMEHRDRARMRD